MEVRSARPAAIAARAIAAAAATTPIARQEDARRRHPHEAAEAGQADPFATAADRPTETMPPAIPSHDSSHDSEAATVRRVTRCRASSVRVSANTLSPLSIGRASGNNTSAHSMKIGTLDA